MRDEEKRRTALWINGFCAAWCAFLAVVGFVGSAWCLSHGENGMWLFGTVVSAYAVGASAWSTFWWWRALRHWPAA